MIKATQPDVLTLDIEMPRMNGLEFLERLMRLHPLPVLMISSLTEQGSNTALDALSLGAVDVLDKPALHSPEAWAEYSALVLDRIRVAARARVHGKRPVGTATGAVAAARSPTPAPRVLADKATPPGPQESGRAFGGKDAVVLIGASTGGTEALRALLSALPAHFPPILVVQHMPATFTKHFAERLDQSCALHVREAAQGDALRWGTALIAPGHSHLRMVQQAGQWRCALDMSEKRNHHRPSVDVLFESAVVLGARVRAVLLTGMGRDGAQGMLALHEQGAHTVCQSEQSCLVFGMPRAAIAIGAASEVMDLDKIAAHLGQNLA
jgi:two-component system chemotaxis response regulator CheB